MVKVKLKQYYNWKNQIQDPIFPHVFHIYYIFHNIFYNIVNAETDQSLD